MFDVLDIFSLIPPFMFSETSDPNNPPQGGKGLSPAKRAMMYDYVLDEEPNPRRRRNEEEA